MRVHGFPARLRRGHLQRSIGLAACLHSEVTPVCAANERHMRTSDSLYVI